MSENGNDQENDSKKAQNTNANEGETTDLAEKSLELVDYVGNNNLGSLETLHFDGYKEPLKGEYSDLLEEGRASPMVYNNTLGEGGNASHTRKDTPLQADMPRLFDNSDSNEESALEISAMLSDGDFDADDQSWIQWFCSMRGNEGFVQVDEEYIQDDFNLNGLSRMVPRFDEALNLILDQEQDESSGNSLSSQEEQVEIEQSAILLYGLIHARFILTNRGMQLVYDKYQRKVWGTCPNVQCGGNPVLPYGTCDLPDVDSVKIYCCFCCEVYKPKNGPDVWTAADYLDGAFFGTTFAELFQMRCLSQKGIEPTPKSARCSSRPLIFGFTVSMHFRDSLSMQRESHPFLCP